MATDRHKNDLNYSLFILSDEMCECWKGIIADLSLKIKPDKKITNHVVDVADLKSKKENTFYKHFP